jgi:hypothetical protein
VQVTVHVIEMSQERAAELLANDADGEAVFRQARGFVKARQARIYDTVIERLVPGQMGTAESIHEHISPTEAEPAEGAGLGSGVPAPSPRYVPDIRLPKVPESFMTRNVGTTLQAGVSAAGKGAVDLDGKWSFAIHAGETVSEDWTDELGNRHQIRRPTYVSFTADLKRILVAGKWSMVSVQSGSDAEGKIDPAKKLVTFVKADDLNPAE